MFATITSYLNKTEKQEANDIFSRIFSSRHLLPCPRPVRTLKVIIQIATKNLVKNDQIFLLLLNNANSYEPSKQIGSGQPSEIQWPGPNLKKKVMGTCCCCIPTNSPRMSHVRKGSSINNVIHHFDIKGGFFFQNLKILSSNLIA